MIKRCGLVSNVGRQTGVESKLHSVADGLFLTHDQVQQGALATAIGACSSTRVNECVEDQKVWIGW